MGDHPSRKNVFVREASQTRDTSPERPGNLSQNSNFLIFEKCPDRYFRQFLGCVSSDDMHANPSHDRTAASNRGPKTNGDCHIGIVGGGTAGWMAAATLRRRLNCRVTLVESDRIAGVGVGEATIPAMLDWLTNMGIDESEFMRATGATYKLAIRFDDWVTPTHRYWHPFGNCGTLDGQDLVHAVAAGRRDRWLSPSRHYTDFSLQRRLCELGRGPRSIDGDAQLENYAFHLDAGRLAAFLKSLAIGDGVEHRIGDVRGATRRGDGGVAAIHIDGQDDLTCDVYLDCTGFAGVLMRQTLGEPWDDWSDQLLCDRAVVTHFPQDRNSGPAPYTISTGLSAGWAWQIPLSTSLGSGYVYSSRHIDDDDAKREWLTHLAASGVADTNEACPRIVPMRVGVTRRAAVKNCVAIGLAAGFIEPLESTGIFLAQRSLDEWVACLSPAESLAQSFACFDHDAFNRRSRIAHEEVRDFVLLHYVLSRRDDTSFWTDARSVELPPSLAAAMDAYRQTGDVLLPGHDPVFADVNHHFIYHGGGVLPAAHPTLRQPTFRSATEIDGLLDAWDDRLSQLTGDFADHADLLESMHPNRTLTCSI